MSTVIQFKASGRPAPRRQFSDGVSCQIVIFPGIRIEHHDQGTDLDLAYRLRDSAGSDDLRGIGGGGRPRRSS